MLAVITFAAIFPIKIIIRNTDEFLIKKITLFFPLIFNSSISACVRENTEDSEMEKIDEMIRNKINNKKEIKIYIIYKCLKVKSIGK